MIGDSRTGGGGGDIIKLLEFRKNLARNRGNPELSDVIDGLPN